MRSVSSFIWGSRILAIDSEGEGNRLGIGDSS